MSGPARTIFMEIKRPGQRLRHCASVTFLLCYASLFNVSSEGFLRHFSVSGPVSSAYPRAGHRPSRSIEAEVFAFYSSRESIVRRLLSPPRDREKVEEFK